MEQKTGRWIVPAIEEIVEQLNSTGKQELSEDLLRIFSVLKSLAITHVPVSAFTDNNDNLVVIVNQPNLNKDGTAHLHRNAPISTICNAILQLGRPSREEEATSPTTEAKQDR